MHNILLPAHHDTLASFVNPRTLIAFDFDGVLAPIVADRDRARLRQRTRELLTRLASIHPCIVVSGRELADLAPRLEGVPLRMVFGNFGHEPPLEGVEPPAAVAGWVAVLRQRLADEHGVVVEDKHFSVAVHYRHSLHPERARRRIEAAMSDLHGGRILQGLLAVMMVPRIGPTKGSTLQAVRRKLHLSRAIYLGDDGTDESAFASADAEHLLAIRVGRAVKSAAAYCLEAQADVDLLLARILAMSTPGTDPHVHRAARQS
jgi:trehalose 6-phosphate phosphatase